MVRARGPKLNASLKGDANTLKYSGLGPSITTDSGGSTITYRRYIPGNSNAFISSAAGISIATNYQEGIFRPGSHVTWVPNLGMTANGRVYVAWIDNPETMVYFETLPTVADLITYLKGVGNMVSHHVAESFVYPIPARSRRKRYDVNASTSTLSVDILERCCQGFIICAVDGCDPTVLAGSLRYTDNLLVEGIAPPST